jgi:hypothetical protein
MADLLDVVTADECAAALDSLDVDDGQLPRYVTAVSRRIDGLCGPVVVRDVTDERHDGGRPTIALREIPVFAITSVTEYRSGTGVTVIADIDDVLATDGYVFDGLSGLLRRTVSGCARAWTPGYQNVKVTYTPGRYATTADVDERFRQAAVMMVRHLWLADQGVGSDMYGLSTVAPFATPNAVVDMLRDDLRPAGVGR